MPGRPAEPPPGYVGVDEAAQRLGWSRSKVHRNRQALEAIQEGSRAPIFVREKCVAQLAGPHRRREMVTAHRERVLLRVLLDSSLQATLAQQRVNRLLTELGVPDPRGFADPALTS